MASSDRKVAIVTGAARGLGRVTALAFAREGAQVVMTDIDETAENFDLHVDTNLWGVFHCMKYEIRQMLKNGGAIVNQSSITGSLTGSGTQSLYAATKGGVDALTKAVALEVAKDNISVIAIAACGIDTPGGVFHQWMERENISP